MFRNFVKSQIARARPELFERALGLSLVRHRFPDLATAKRFETREGMWLEALKVAGDPPLRFVEFGVWQGYSINFFAKNCISPELKLYGFDSFEGLPEDWTRDVSRGAFSTGGRIPDKFDERVEFVKGWFNHTVPGFIEHHRDELRRGRLIVHFDADLYSSTLFCLCQLDRLGRQYLAVFDEFFSGHETRALHDYCKAFGAQVEMLGRTGGPTSLFPAQVMCWIRPRD